MLACRVLGGLAVGLTLTLVACVSDESVDLAALNDAGAPTPNGSSGSSGDASANNPKTTCGTINESPFPTCPAITDKDDPTCDSAKPVCCRGTGCVARGEACPNGGGAALECFSGAPCGGKGCCLTGTQEPQDFRTNRCGDEEELIQLPLTVGSVCDCSKTTGTRLCRGESDCVDGKTCKPVRVLIQSSGKEPFERKIGICR